MSYESLPNAITKPKSACGCIKKLCEILTSREMVQGNWKYCQGTCNSIHFDWCIELHEWGLDGRKCAQCTKLAKLEIEYEESKLKIEKKDIYIQLLNSKYEAQKIHINTLVGLLEEHKENLTKEQLRAHHVVMDLEREYQNDIRQLEIRLRRFLPSPSITLSDLLDESS